MKTRIKLVIGMFLLTAGIAGAQDTDSLMAVVLKNNRALIAAKEAANTAILQAGTGNTPPNPEVEFAYLFGEPAHIGHKTNIVVKQQADFPTAYVHRSKLKKIRVSGVGLEYRALRQEVLSEARRLWVEHLYLKQSLALLDQRYQRAAGVHAHFEEMMSAGEVGPLELGQSQLMLASVLSEREEAHSRLEMNHLALDEISGGNAPEIRDSLFPQPVDIREDSLLSAYGQGPVALRFEKEYQQKQAELRLARSKHLPKVSAGYFSEAISTEAFRGFTVGFSVPLWENTNTMKTARSGILQAEAEREHFFLELLSLSLEQGEISLAEYFYNSDFYYRNQQLLLSYRRDLLTLEAGLLKVFL